MAKNPTVTCLLELFDQAFNRKSWHGTNLRGSIRRVTAEQAAWRPRADRHCIADIVLHCAYWKYSVRRRFTGEKRGSFAVDGSNWFKVPAPLSEKTWASYVALLDAEHKTLRAVLAALGDADLGTKTAGSSMTHRQVIDGIIFHDIYHAGQIQILKRLPTTADGAL